MKGLPYVISSVALLAGCANHYERAANVPPDELQKFVADKPAESQRLFARVPLEGPRNETLNYERAGLAALQLDADAVAADAFDKALLTIEAIYADNEKAKEARSLWTKENFKDFKGEPHERAMAYYYRGLLYLRAGDYENARASFKGGLNATAFSYNENYAASFPLMSFLEGWAGRCAGAGSSATDAFKEASSDNPYLGEPSAAHDLLILIERGAPPIKVGTGKYKERLAFIQGANSDISVAKIAFSDDEKDETRNLTALNAADLHKIAINRGGRAIDAILAGKADFKSATNTAGDVGVGLGVGLMAGSNDRNVQGVGAIITLVGLLAKAASEAANPEADLRTWDNLPGRIDLVTASSASLAATAAPATTDSAELKAAIKYLDRKSTVMRTDLVTAKGTGRCRLLWGRAISALAVPDSAPNAIRP